MSLAARNSELTRRRSILALLFFAPGQVLTARKLRDELEAVHGQVATVDKVRADLFWLADVGLLQAVADTATLTDRGREVVQDRAVMPGEA
jgi:Fe2+ or Zn2+ uptake regulation protein